MPIMCCTDADHVCFTDADHVWAALHEHTTGARVRGHRYAQCTATSWTSSAFSCASTHTHVAHVALRLPMHDGSVRVSTMQACLEFACRIVQLHMIVGISCSASATPASQSNAAPATTASQSNAISMIDACSRNRMHGGQCIAVEIECNIGNIRVAVAYTIGNQSLLSSAPSQST